jgi:hypothetical protein
VTKKRKKPKPQLILRMIVAGMNQAAMTFAVAGYAAVRSEEELGVRNKVFA